MSNPSQTSIDEKYSVRGENTLDGINNKFKTAEEIWRCRNGGGRRLKKYWKLSELWENFKQSNVLINII